MTEQAVLVDEVAKRFRIYQERNQSLKASLVRGRRARYDEFWALDGVSFEVAKGETFGIIGHNGSGKSTMLKCVARILRPDRGRVTVTGTLSALLELGAGFHPELSGRENVYLNAAILGLSRRDVDARFDDIVGFAGLERFIDTPVKTYSSGMFVRLGFAVAINVEPDVLLIDEVLAVGDESFQRKCSEKIAEFRAEGRTIVIVSHGVGALRQLCNRVAWLDHGALKALGTGPEVVDAYMADAHAGRVSTEEDGIRWGSGEVRVHRIELLDESGAAITTVRTGATVTVRVHYRARERVPEPVFGLAIMRIDGLAVTSPDLSDVGLVPASIEGEGYIDATFDDLSLLEGTYEISIGVGDRAELITYDHWEKPLRFDVERGTPFERRGLVTMRPRWTVA
jgi:ABC-type polysaccharide/polyol phosphate transport system ATPase subunit